MKLRRNWQHSGLPTIVTIGNFDGIHVGHKSLLDIVNEQKDDNEPSLTSLVMTFEPHPVQTLRPEHAPFKVIDLRTKLSILAKHQIDQLNVMHFTRHLAQMQAADFVKNLATKLNTKILVVGSDFNFGNKRQGNIELLASLSDKYGYKLVVAEDQMTNNNIKASSKLLRTALVDADFAFVKQILERDYQFGGRVVHGSKLGKELNCPTANLHFKGVLPLHGVYAAKVTLENGNTDANYKAALAVGYRPAVGGTKQVIEVHLLDFDKEIYGTYMNVQPVAKIRDEQNFDDLSSLAQQMQIDVQACRELLGNK